MHSCTDRTPYTYLIGWTGQNRWYYGCRFGKGCHPSDLWVTYFTSSKLVRIFREKYGEPNIIQIRRVFSDVNKCRLVEHITLRRLKVVNKDKWLNKTDNKSIEIEAAMRGHKNRPSRKGIPNSANSIALKGRIPWNKGLRGDTRCINGAIKAANTRKLLGNCHPHNKGIPMSDEQKQKLRNYKKTPEHCRNIKLAKQGKPAHNKGVSMTEEQKEKLRKSKQGKKFEKKTCPHCRKIGGGPNMTRFHFEKCKLNPNFDQL